VIKARSLITVVIAQGSVRRARKRMKLAQVNQPREGVEIFSRELI
jgi:hypothetical protein